MTENTITTTTHERIYGITDGKHSNVFVGMLTVERKVWHFPDRPTASKYKIVKSIGTDHKPKDYFIEVNDELAKFLSDALQELIGIE